MVVLLEKRQITFVRFKFFFFFFQTTEGFSFINSRATATLSRCVCTVLFCFLLQSTASKSGEKLRGFFFWDLNSHRPAQTSCLLNRDCFFWLAVVKISFFSEACVFLDCVRAEKKKSSVLLLI